MGKQVCGNGHEWKSRFQPSFAELRCPEDGCGLPAEPSLKAGRSGLSKPEPRAIADAHTRFSSLVCEWPCWFRDHRNGHTCWGDLDPHHLVPASWIKDTFRDLSDVELGDILYAPIIGTPLCRKAHDAVENRSAYIYWHELDPECAEFCKQVDARYPGRPSMLSRLELESPKRDSVAA
jgi:hypothetical protein